MSSISFNSIYNKITKRLLSNKWLQRSNINRSIIENIIKSEVFSDNLHTLLKFQNFSCMGVLSLCKEMMDQLCNSRPPEDWLYYVYQYTLNKAFPEAKEIQLLNYLSPSCELYLRLLRIISDAQKSSKDETWFSKFPLLFLTEEEENELEHPDEYRKFVKAFRHDYIYEMMKLSSEVLGYNTLEHICGVHYLALFTGRQFKTLGLPIDLGRVSGAAAGHDIGKYGCKPNESKRVPYLHYYYSDQWFKKYGINYIRNIAINHSTWDLELENLSLESLILIYSDFRVKNKVSSEGVSMQIFTLKDSFNVILGKLDNIDEAKEKRYKRVYEKLKDFEDFMKCVGISTDINQYETLEASSSGIERRNFSLLQGSEIIDNFKYLSINHNIKLMYNLRDEYSLEAILESARSEKDWKNLREYIRVLEEYSTYLTQNQKLQTIKFMYDNLVHPEDDIRRHCAELIGILIAIYDEDYRKELPQDVIAETPSTNSFELLNHYISVLLSPSHKIIPLHRFWLGYSVSIILSSLLKHCRKNLMPLYRKAIVSYLNDRIYRSSEIQIFLLETMKHLSYDMIDESIESILAYVMNMLSKRNIQVRLSALEVLHSIISKLPEHYNYLVKVKEYMLTNSTKSRLPSENMLKLKIAKLLTLSDILPILELNCKEDEKEIPNIFLNNLKTDTEWIIKRTQIKLLLENTLKNTSSGLHTALHFCNLLKVSAVESVRSSAGSAILEIVPTLSLAERNEVAIELLRALEIEGNRFTEYIPFYLGQIILFLQPKELDEIIDDLSIKIKSSSSNVKSLVLKTLGISVSNYKDYRTRFEESESSKENRLLNMLGILLNGLGDYSVKVKQASFSTLGKDIFGSKLLDLSEKVVIFKYIGKKILTLVTDNKNEELLFLTNSAALNHIYRFISDYSFYYGEINLKIPEKVAFFPGSFDPFSLSHKEIARSIRDLGFEVYLAVDEFSWSKKTLPNLIRRNILNMSTADEPNIYIYPDIYPTNLANSKDLMQLKNNFPNSEVYVAVGSDVVLNASSYKALRTENSIHNFNHIIFERGKSKRIEESTKHIMGDVVFLTLPSKYTDISSTQIRNYIDDNRDISSLIDPLAQQYIYDNGFYQKEPLEKSSISSLWLKIDIIEDFSAQLIDEICNLIPDHRALIHKKLKDHLNKPSGRIIVLRDTRYKEEILGFSAFHWIRSSMLYEELKDLQLSQYIRENSSGRTLLISGFFIKENEKNTSLEQILLTETLSFSIAKDYQYSIYRDMFHIENQDSIHEILRLQGFMEISSKNAEYKTFAVNMSAPCILNLDLENIIKEPFRSNFKVKFIISSSRKRLQEALTKLYPGELILSFDSDTLHQTMIRKICHENCVSTEITFPRKLGSNMCVPYGDILERFVIPNTVTKSLHTEKFFHSDMKLFDIGEFPYYLDLPTQIKMIKSFDRPVILVDNILHKGYRMKALDPLLTNEGIKVDKIITGILSGRGKDLMDMQNREVDSVYFIPGLKIWFNENALYPFIGGDTLWRGVYPERNLLPSINLIMPYTYPTFIRGSNMEAIYNLSLVCIENAIDILTTLENEYHILHERNLTLHYLGQVLTIPRCPDQGNNMEYDLNSSPSAYLKNHLELLKRFEYMIKDHS